MPPPSDKDNRDRRTARAAPGSGGGPGGGASGGAYPEPIQRLIAEFANLPGIGNRSAERLAFHILKSGGDEAMRLSQAIADVKRKVKHCSICFNLADIDPCSVCSSPARDASVVMVIEQPRDLIALEQTGLFRGVYHVLMGRLDPLAGIGPDDVTISQLLKRVEHPESNSRGIAVQEVILGLNPDMEGDTTALHIADLLGGQRSEVGGQRSEVRGERSEVRGQRSVKVTRLARGLPSGSQLEYVSRTVLGDAILGRQSMGDGAER
jgi:recombination protein RecR